MHRFILAIPFLAFGFPLQAQMNIPGTDDPLFRAATSAWLNGEDEGAVRLLFALASSGSTSAQVLLGLIARERWGFENEEWLTRQDVRANILSQPSDNPFMGTPWLEVARQNLPIQEMFDGYTLIGRSRDLDDALLRMADVLEVGETRLFTDLVQMSINAGNTAHLFDLYDSGILPTTLLPLVYNELRNEHLLSGHVSSVEDIESYTDLVNAYGSFNTGYTQLLWQWFLPSIDLRPNQVGTLEGQAWSLAELDPVRGFCSRACPDSVPQCLVSMMAFGPSGGLYRATLSPMEALIETESYQVSERFDEDMLALARHTWGNLLPPEEQEALSRYDSCMPELVSSAP